MACEAPLAGDFRAFEPAEGGLAAELAVIGRGDRGARVGRVDADEWLVVDAPPLVI